jgi:hypothetical protein
MKHHIPLKYECLDDFGKVYQLCEQQEVKNLLLDLRELIQYQMEQIRDQRTEIISFKHKNAWKHYDRPIDEYNTETRSYVDKPAKSGNMSC